MLVNGINSIKKPFVDKLLEQVKYCSLIDGIILFGSVLTENCCTDSDVDFFIVTQADIYSVEYNEQLTLLMSQCYAVQETETDILTISTFADFFTKENVLLNDIRERNAYCIIYKRGVVDE